jgi:hypothetical protein
MKNEIKAFDSNVLLEVSGFTFDNSEDKVSIYGTIDIKRDLDGLTQIESLLEIMNVIHKQLLKEKDTLPEKLENKEVKIVQNPF